MHIVATSEYVIINRVTSDFPMVDFSFLKKQYIPASLDVCYINHCIRK